MDMDNIPLYDFSKLDWRTSTTDPRRIYRDLNGSEIGFDRTNRLEDGNANIFLVMLLSIQTAISRTELREMATESWLELRSNVPIIAAKLEELEDGGEGESGKRTCLTYTSPDVDDARAWAARTVRLYDNTHSGQGLG